VDLSRRHMGKVLVVCVFAALLAVCVLAYFSCPEGTLESRAKELINQRIENGVAHADVLTWIQQQKATTEYIHAEEDLVGHTPISELAGIPGDTISFTIRSRLPMACQTWYSRVYVDIYFFFDDQDRLIRPYIREVQIAF
jgi:hypothetical protein